MFDKSFRAASQPTWKNPPKSAPAQVATCRRPSGGGRSGAVDVAAQSYARKNGNGRQGNRLPGVRIHVC